MKQITSPDGTQSDDSAKHVIALFVIAEAKPAWTTPVFTYVHVPALDTLKALPSYWRAQPLDDGRYAVLRYKLGERLDVLADQRMLELNALGLATEIAHVPVDDGTGWVDDQVCFAALMQKLAQKNEPIEVAPDAPS